MKKAIVILITIILLSPAAVFAQAPAVCAISDVVYNPDGTVASGAQFRISKITKNGVLISQGPFTYIANVSGNISFSVVRGATVYIYSTVAPFNVTGGVAVTVPNSSTASLAALATVASVPTSGLTVQTSTGPTTLANKEGTLWFTSGLKATETTPGVAKIEIDTASTAIVPGTRTISATNPIRIDGSGSADMSANRTISLNGLSGLGTANQITGMNSGATAFEYKSFGVGTSGSDFAIAHSANLITFNLPDASASNRGLVTTGIQTIAGAKTFASVPVLIQVPVGDPAQGNTASANMLRGADSSSGSPLNSDIASTFVQTIRTGGTNGVVRFGFLENYQVLGISAADNIGRFIIGRLSPSMSGTPAGAYFHELNKSYLILSPTNISGQTIHGYATTAIGERTVTGVRMVGIYGEIRNSTASDASTSIGSIDTTFNIVTSQNGTSHNTGIWYAEGPSNALAGYFGAYFDANSVAQRVFDLSPTTFTLQGTWTATNGSATVSGSGGHGDKEALAKQWLLINGTVARVSSATANSISLTGNFAGTTGSGLTITKSADAIWLRENQPILALNHAGTSRNEILRYTEGDRIKLDEDAVGVQFGGFTSFGANNGTIGAPSNTVTTGWRAIGYEATGSMYGWGVEGGYLWHLGDGQKFYVGSSNSPVLALTLANTGAATFAGDATVSGLLKAGSTPTTLTNSSGVILDAAIVSALTGKTYNGLTISTSTGTLTVDNGKTGRFSNTLTFTGTDSSSVAFGGGGTIGGVGYSANGQVAATATNDDAASGKVGEYVTSNIASGSAITLTTGVTANLTSLSLTAGDWDVWVIAYFVPGGTVSALDVGVSQTSATFDFTNGSFTQSAYANPSTTQSQGVGPVRVKLSGSTTVYGVVNASFGTSMTAYGLMRARRVR